MALREGSNTDQLARLKIGEAWSKVEQIDRVDQGERIQRRLGQLASNVVARATAATGQEYVLDTGFSVMNSKCIYAVVIVTRTR